MSRKSSDSSKNEYSKTENFKKDKPARPLISIESFEPKLEQNLVDGKGDERDEALSNRSKLSRRNSVMSKAGSRRASSRRGSARGLSRPITPNRSKTHKERNMDPNQLNKQDS